MLTAIIILPCILCVFLILKIRKCFLKLLKDNDFLYFIKSRCIYLSSFIGSFMFPIIQAVWIMIMMNGDKQGYIIALYFHTLFSIVVFIFFLLYFLKKRRLLCGFTKKRLRYFFVNTLLVFASYIVLLPIFWFIFGLFSVFYYAWGFK